MGWGREIQASGDPRPLMATKSIPSHIVEQHLASIKFKTEFIVSLMSVFPFVYPVSVNDIIT